MFIILTDIGLLEKGNALERQLANSYDYFYLTVQPGTPRIMGIDGVIIEPTTPDQVIDTVSVPHGHNVAKIKCIVGPAKPAIPIRWWVMLW